ncbi:MAG: hypothetical protein JOZ82_03200 [Marmoricola sp.]|nr:hypothetical protein [Marmoricola sp.]
MGVPLLIVAALLGLVILCLVLAVLARGRRRARRELAAARAETELLRARLEAVEERLETTSAALVETRDAYLITDAGVERAEPTVPDRVVLSATFGEPLVKIVALGHGVARALSPESRNRIRFEMRREVRRARKQRRRDMKQAYRAMRDEERNAA